MPTRINTNFPRPTDEDEFESLIRDICIFEWGDPNTQKFGRKGQKQHGVDVYGQPSGFKGRYRAAQCKLRTTNKALTEKQIEKEVREAKQFPHPLDMLILVTDLPRDTHTQILVDQISKRETAQGGFRLVIWFWNEITERLAAYPKLIVTYYRDYFANLTTLPTVEKLVEIPLRVLSLELTKAQEVEECLKLRGIRIYEPDDLLSPVSELEPDGILCQYDNTSDNQLLKFASTVQRYEPQVEPSCPIFVLLPSKLLEEFKKNFQLLGGKTSRIQILALDLPVDEVANHLFHSVFDYGYRRRGGLPTIDIAARASANKPRVALLDLDWQTRLSMRHFPTPQEWEESFIPALAVVTNQLISLGDSVRIQIESQLFLPAALALGFFLNLRVARVGVWARQLAVSDFKQQFWLSDGEQADITCRRTWVKSPDNQNQSAIVELTTFVTIHKAVKPFAEKLGLDVGAWCEVGLAHEVDHIDEGTAVAFANEVGRIIRQLNALGITDIHLFARMPSALAVLVGQRLQACGRIHLYWFDNPTYRFAFTLK